MRVGGMNNVRLGQAAYDINLTLLLSDYRKKTRLLVENTGQRMSSFLRNVRCQGSLRPFSRATQFVRFNSSVSRCK